MLAHPSDMARFNAWANQQLHGACAALPDEALSEDLGAFFGSVMGTLNHIYLVDCLYRDRLEGRKSSFTGLDQILHPSLTALSEAQFAQDAHYIERAAGLDQRKLDETIGFHTLLEKPEYWEVTLRTYFSNLFQHQIHHRGQAHSLLSRQGITPPPIGYIEYELEHGESISRTVSE